MKILKTALYIIMLLLALITILISQGNILSKFANFTDNAYIHACGYIPYFWILALSMIVFLSFILLRHIRVALSYFSVMMLFTLFLGDFALNSFIKRNPEQNRNYEHLKVITYNVRYYSFGIDKIIQFIRHSDADVLFLSESVLSASDLEYLKNKLPGYSVISDQGHDVALLSRFPVVDHKLVSLPTSHASLSGSNDPEKVEMNKEHRSFIHAKINVHGTDVNVLSLRLIAGRAKDKSISEGLKWGKYLIEAQDKELSVFLDYVKTLNGPVVFGGDLNAPPNSGIIHTIAQYADDAYLDVHPFGSFTFRTAFSVMRLDYIFHTKDVIVKESEIVNVLLSDHFPVKAEFLIPVRDERAMK
jgi:endonuclease/exonuclease/phosphatase (EEP) superfamily protein YafD